MKDVFVVLTGDHGMPPTNLPKDRMTSENIKEDLYPKLVEEELRKNYGSPRGGDWVQSVAEFQIYLNPVALADAKISAAQAISRIRPRLLKEFYVDSVWSKDEILYDRKVPAGELGSILDRTLSFRSGDLITVLKPFFYSDSYRFTHMTHYSYDRYVPLLFWGKTFNPEPIVKSFTSSTLRRRFLRYCMSFHRLNRRGESSQKSCDKIRKSRN